MEAIHPIVRIHPVIGWKTLFAMDTHCKKINGLSQIHSMIMENHDLQVRFWSQILSDIGMSQSPSEPPA